MINIYVEDNHIEINGHANYAETGKDIVCGAISCLFFTMCNALEDYSLCEIKQADGHAEVKYTPLGNEAKIAVKTCVDGMQMVAEEYPDHVRIVRG